MFLNSLGQLFIVGTLNAEALNQRGASDPARLLFPPGYPPTTGDRYEPVTAIRQYSVGRSHIVGLSDSGKIWEWSNIGKPGQLVKLISVDVVEGPGLGKGTVTHVVSGKKAFSRLPTRLASPSD